MTKKISLILVLTILLKPLATFFVTPFCVYDKFNRCANDTLEMHFSRVFYHFEFYIIIFAFITYFLWYFNHLNLNEFDKIKSKSLTTRLSQVKSFSKQKKLASGVIISIIIFLLSPDSFFTLLFLTVPLSFFWLRKNHNIKLSSDTLFFLIILGVISLFFHEATTSKGLSAADEWGDLLVYPLIFIIFPSYTYFLSGILCYLINRSKVSTKLIDKHARIWILFFSCVMIYGFFAAIK